MKTETKFTPGPYAVEKAEGALYIVGDGQRIARVPLSCTQDYDNANLFAAAPSLYEALKELSEAVKALREGKRDGGTMGIISSADDAAQAALALVEKGGGCE